MAKNKKLPQPRDCGYIRASSAFFNAGGHLPCGTCAGCRSEREAHERTLAFNRATEAGAKPNR